MRRPFFFLYFLYKLGLWDDDDDNGIYEVG